MNYPEFKIDMDKYEADQNGSRYYKNWSPNLLECIDGHEWDRPTWDEEENKHYCIMSFRAKRKGKKYLWVMLFGGEGIQCRKFDPIPLSLEEEFLEETEKCARQFYRVMKEHGYAKE